MNFIPNPSIGDYEGTLNSLPAILAPLNVATERDLYDTTLLYHKIPIIDMQPIPSSQMQEAVEWVRDNIIEHKIVVSCIKTSEAVIK